jgi:anti-anti-sigma factor
METKKDTSEFDFNIIDGQALVIVNLVGNIEFESIEKFRSIAKAVAEYKSAKFVILDMTKVDVVDSKMIFDFARMQKEIRDMKFQLRICSIKSALKKKLYDRGVIRDVEISENLTIAVRSLLAKIRDERKNGRGDPLAA